MYRLNRETAFAINMTDNLEEIKEMWTAEIAASGY